MKLRPKGGAGWTGIDKEEHSEQLERAWRAGEKSTMINDELVCTCTCM